MNPAPGDPVDALAQRYFAFLLIARSAFPIGRLFIELSQLGKRSWI
jgi:hypothetical protein